jgi:hypothetical protein
MARLLTRIRIGITGYALRCACLSDAAWDVDGGSVARTV